MRKLYNYYSPMRTSIDLSNCLSQISIEQPESDSSVHKLCNELLLKYYPNEAAIKSAFSNQFFFHSPKHVSVYELNVGHSRLDMCKINGTSIAYEIKTDFDNFNRLEKQLEDYLYVFEKVYVICSQERFHDALLHIPDICGIYSYIQTRTGSIRFKKERNALPNKLICSHKQLANFTKNELVSFFNVPMLPSRSDMEEYIFSNFSDDYINNAFKENIKLKYQHNWRFLYQNYSRILDIDYQWFFQNEINPDLMYR